MFANKANSREMQEKLFVPPFPDFPKHQIQFFKSKKTLKLQIALKIQIFHRNLRKHHF